MNADLEQTEQVEQKKEVKIQGGSSDSVYGLGLIGAWVYFIGRATTTEERIKGFFKGFVWPALLVYELFVFFEEK